MQLLPDAPDQLPEHARELNGASVGLTWHRFGDLVLPSGALLACDPLILDEPYLSTLGPIALTAGGRYPLLAATAPLTGWGVRIAFALLCVQRGDVASWQQPEEAPRFAVDSGVASFIDRDAAHLLAAHLAADYRYGEDLYRLMEMRSPRWVNTTLVPATGANLVAMKTAKGDDLYACRAGYTASGALACLALDFRAIDLASLLDVR